MTVLGMNEIRTGAKVVIDGEPCVSWKMNL